MVTRIHSVDDFVYFSLNFEYESNNTIIALRQFIKLFIPVFFLIDINSQIKHFYLFIYLFVYIFLFVQYPIIGRILTIR
jgi:hypothetical protein